MISVSAVAKGISTILLVFIVTAFISPPITAQTLKSSGYAPVNGLRLYYELHGEGRPLLLLHGSYMTIGLNWGELIPEFAKTRKVIAVEMQGHGRTADINRPFSYSDLAKDITALMKYLKIDSVDVIGYSFGGTIAYELAIQNPSLVNKAVILSSVFRHDGWSPAVRSGLASFKPEFLDSTPLKAVYDSIAPDKSRWHAFVKKLSEFNIKPFDLGEESVKNIKCPVLIVNGDSDGARLEHIAKAFKLVGGAKFGDMEGLSKSEFAILPATTHVGLMMKTQNLLSIINPFLDK